MKGLILCAGKGTRMRPITYAIPKPLIPVANKPVIHFAFEEMRRSGIEKVGIVVGDNRKDIEPYLGGGAEWGLEFTFIEQTETLGIAHAVLCSEEFMAGEDFLLFLGDNLLENGFSGLADEYRKGGADAAIMLKAVPEPQHFGVAVVRDGKIVSIHEKPAEPESNLAVIGVYIFNSKVFDAAKNIKPSARGELEITDTIAMMIKMGCSVSSHTVNGWWKDTGRKSDMIEANRAVLDSYAGNIAGTVDDKSEIVGMVIIEKGAEVKNSRIYGPSIIGIGAKISDSYIGPYSSIGNSVEIMDSEVENSIIMTGARISGIGARIESSLIGRYAVIEKTVGRPKTIELALGDHCRLMLP